ncbi:NACHT domain-containing protein [Azospirillum sp. YIM B02556]|uniref:NACHT domain-containing protein n=1 Tax=Azospirillum endophyticum TaxID=2800326 RepID=A0ABS1FCY2_9PROT|nr:NACHT domain-containing protein [Azospirillum endophyticum]MBK1841257.1 NACHT domain-containing protein [Azospirillum endophyticum]
MALVTRFVFFLLLGCMASGMVFVGWRTAGLLLALPMLVVALCLMWLGAGLARYASVTEGKIRLAAMTLGTSVALAALAGPQQWIAALAASTLPTIIPGLASLPVAGDPSWSGVVVMLLTVVLAWVIVSQGRIPLVMGERRSSTRRPLPVGEELRHLREAIEKQLRIVADRRRLSPSEMRYSLLAVDAVGVGWQSRTRLPDLLTALRHNQRGRLFVVVGDPGSGKSVALRQLAADLLKARDWHPLRRREQLLPLYVDLKEWRESAGEGGALPDEEAFGRFVKSYVIREIGIVARRLFGEGTLFEDIHASGGFFFIFDSFDEIPAVLDHADTSRVVAELSDTVAKYATAGNARAIIASRPFRSPKVSACEPSRLEVVPLGEYEIERVVRSTLTDPADFMQTIRHNRSDLGQLARNPFLLHLIIEYVRNFAINTERYPSSQRDMFASFHKRSLAEARQRIHGIQCADHEVDEVCEVMVLVMFNRENPTLHLSHADLEISCPHPALLPVLALLAEARLGHMDADGGFTFSHRRFAEYHLVLALENGRMDLHLDAIQQDQRWRDTLVLYAEVANPDCTSQLIKHAWSYASLLSNLSPQKDIRTYREARNALRFLCDGYRNRPDDLGAIRTRLQRSIETKLVIGGDLIEKKVMFDAVGLLPSGRRTSRIITTAIFRFPGWASEGAVVAARYLPRLEPDLAFTMFRQALQPGLKSPYNAWQQANALTLCDAYSQVAKWLREYSYDTIRAAIATIILAGIAVWSYSEEYAAPLAAICIGGMTLIYAWINFAFVEILKPLAPSSKDRSSSDKSRPASAWLRRIFHIGGRQADPTARTSVLAPKTTLVCEMPDFREPLHQCGIILVSASTASAFLLIAENRVPTGAEWISAWFIVFLGIFGYFPARTIFWIRARLVLSKMSQPQTLKKLAKFAKFIIVTGAIYGILSYVLMMIAGEAALSLALSGIFFAFIISVLTVLTWGLISDGWVVWQSTRDFVASRAKIAASFTRLKTQFVRRIYIHWVASRSFPPSGKIVRPLDFWPDGNRPEFPGDKASTQLAQIDAKWLELE